MKLELSFAVKIRIYAKLVSLGMISLYQNPSLGRTYMITDEDLNTLKSFSL